MFATVAVLLSGATAETLIKEVTGCHSHLQLHKWLTRWVCKAGGPTDYFFVSVVEHVTCDTFILRGPHHCTLAESICAREWTFSFVIEKMMKKETIKDVMRRGFFILC